MGKNLADKLNTGLTPQQFMDRMTKNKEQFIEWGEAFTWPSAEDQEFFQSLSHRDDLRCLILAADWCGDVVHNVPVVFRALSETEMPVEVLIIEENLDVMDQFLTMGGRAIPIVIFTDTGGYVLGQWGPRTKYIQEPMVQFKAGNPDRNASDYVEKIQIVRQEIKQRYGTGTEYQAVIIQELRDLLASL